MADAELHVSSAKLEGFPPFSMWNSTLAAPLENTRGLCSVLSADGELVVLQIGSNDDHAVSGKWLRVLKVLPPIVEKPSTFCQCWTTKGEVIVTAHERSVVIYSSNDFKVLLRLEVRCAVNSVDITKSCQAESDLLLVVGTAFGCFLYKVVLRSKDDSERDVPAQTPVSKVYDGISVCIVKFSRDGRIAAIGTVDGRLFLRNLCSHAEAELATFGSEVLSRVLMAPRMTSISFSVCNTKLVVATKKGNVYVFVCPSNTSKWKIISSCKDLSVNPKPEAISMAGSNKAATAAQTLVACWGPLFVVCSRAAVSQLEIYDFESGSLLRSLQLMPAVASAKWVEYPLVTGVSIMQLGEGMSRLLCHDTNANLTVIEWPFVDIIAQR